MTTNAQRILEIINASTAHPTAEDIYRNLLGKGEKMSLATVYNSLGRLYEDGAVRKIPMNGEPDRYDKTRRHDHLICESAEQFRTRCWRIFAKRLKKNWG